MQQKRLGRRGKKMENCIYGYARVSTQDQDCSIQREALRKAGCTMILEEKGSGTSRNGRTELERLLGFIRKGDTLMVTRIDRLARSMKDLQDIVHELKAKGVALTATEQPVDTGSAAGKACWACLPNSRPTYAKSASSKASPRQKPLASMPAKAASRRSTAPG